VVRSYCPVTLEEALLIRLDESVIPYAGGTDLIAARRRGTGLLPRFQRPVLFIGHLSECRGISDEQGLLKIGGATTMSEVLEDVRVPDLLRQAAEAMASPAVRNVATLGGNICHASPAGDTLPPLYLWDATVTLQSVLGERDLKLAEFIVGPGRTDLRDDEILTTINIPECAATATWYHKVATRRSSALAKISLAAQATVRDGVLDDLRLAVGAVAPMVVRSRTVEEFLIGRTKTDLRQSWPEIMKEYDDLLAPIDDQRSTAAYRRKTTLRLIRYFLTREAWKSDDKHPDEKG
jgi:CO/xanthine dehydrogenase FAD-binding subunit